MVMVKGFIVAFVAAVVAGTVTAAPVQTGDIITDSFCVGEVQCVYAQRNTTSDHVTFTIQSSVTGKKKLRE
jgi:hypothetical protein